MWLSAVMVLRSEGAVKSTGKQHRQCCKRYISVHLVCKTGALPFLIPMHQYRVNCKINRIWHKIRRGV